MYKMGWFVVVRGHSRSLKIASSDRAYIQVPSTVSIGLPRSYITSVTLRDIGRTSRILTFLACIWRQRWEWQQLNFTKAWLCDTQSGRLTGRQTDSSYKFYFWSTIYLYIRVCITVISRARFHVCHSATLRRHLGRTVCSSITVWRFASPNQPSLTVNYKFIVQCS